jgi:diguanylate cyclase (GGDEF)-like protein/PAS domain S-box-containing protein
MLDLQMVKKKWAVLKDLFRFKSLSTGILIAMGTGLLIPAAIGIILLDYLRQDKTSNDIEFYLNDRITLLANSLALPVWNYDLNLSNEIAQASLQDQQVVRITISDTNNNPILNLEHAERSIGRPHTASKKLLLKNELAGFVTVVVDDGLMKRKSQQDQLAYTYILFGQFALTLIFIMVALHLRVLKPLTALTAFSNQLADGNFDYTVGWQRSDEIGHLATQLDQMRRDLQAAFSEQQAILDNVPAGVIFIRDGIIQQANRYAETIFGYEQGDLCGLRPSELYTSKDQFIAIRDRARSTIATFQSRYAEELLLKRLNGTEFWARISGCGLDPLNLQAGSIWVFEDISERKAAESEINHLAFYDPLTQLPNRRLLLDRLKQALNSSSRSKKCGALLFIDLDDFKTLNDTFGHETGDNLLQQVANRLTMCVRQDDTVARLGGDEFVILLEDLNKEIPEAAAQAKHISEKIHFALNQTYLINNHQRYSTPSIGVTLFMDHSENIEELLKRADMAMYEAKTAGRNTIRFFDQKMQDMLINRTVMEDGLRQAIIKEEFQLYYQPQIISTGKWIGVEALIRWIHPHQGLISPAAFIPLAEESGLILPLGNWVLNTACKQMAIWAYDKAMANLSIAVNVSACQFHQPNFVQEVLTIIEQTGANPSRLKLELTESMLVNDIEDIIKKMTLLKAHGIGFSLDDFGTGYSSLSYLKRLPLDQLKIDQSFVRNILTDVNDAAIAKMVVALGLSLNLNVIAEGVELEAQRDYLDRLGCNAYQGYLFSKPLPLRELEALCNSKTAHNNTFSYNAK